MKDCDVTTSACSSTGTVAVSSCSTLSYNVTLSTDLTIDLAVLGILCGSNSAECENSSCLDGVELHCDYVFFVKGMRFCEGKDVLESEGGVIN